jgi:hypothetical protein
MVSYLVQSLDSGILSQVVELEHAHEVWSTIEELFSSQSCSRANMLRGALAKTKKTSDDIDPIYRQDEGICI